MRQLGLVFSSLLLFFGWMTELSAKVKEGSLFPAKVNLSYIGKEGSLAFSKFKGRVVVVDFWASWCEPCKIAMPQLNKIYKELRKKGVVVVGVNVDDDQKLAKDFLKKHPVQFPVVYDKGKKLIEAVGVSTMPTSFILDRSRRVRHIHRGFRSGDENEVRNQLVKILKKAQSKVASQKGN